MDSTIINHTFSHIRSVREIQPFGTTNVTYTPTQIGKAYNIKSVNNSSGKKKVVITIVVAYHYTKLQNDFNRFCNKYNIYPTGSKIPPTLEIFNMSTSSISRGGKGWQTEACIDVQLAYAMNPNAHIRVVQAKSSINSDLFSAIAFANSVTNNTSTKSANYSSFGSTDIISLSWGQNEYAGEANYNSYFQNKNICFTDKQYKSNYCI
jgi:hypothetical protein